MRVTRTLRTVKVADGRGRSVEAIVRVREIDARVAGQGAVLRTEEPVTLLVRDRDTLRRVAMPEKRGGFPALAWMAAPVAAMVIARVCRPRRSR